MYKSALTSSLNGNSTKSSEESYYTAPENFMSGNGFDFGKQFDALLEEGEIVQQDNLCSMSLQQVIETFEDQTHYVKVKAGLANKLKGLTLTTILKDGCQVFGFSDLNEAADAHKLLLSSRVDCNFVRAGAVGLDDALVSRVVIAGIQDSSVDALVLKSNMSGFGNVHKIEQLDAKGSFVVEFCDHRDALYAVENLDGKCCYGSSIRVVLWKDGQPLEDLMEAKKKLKALPELKIVTSTQVPAQAPQQKVGAKPPRLSNLQMLSEMKKRQSAWSSEGENTENQIDLIKILQGSDSRATFMIRNIPNKYTQEMLIDFLDEVCFGTFDFLYLRMDYVNNCNCGYAFINFKQAHDVVSLATCIIGKKWPKFNSDKVGSMSYATVQGLDALIAKFRDSSVMNEQETYQPKLFKNGQPVKFPQPSVGGYRRLGLKQRMK